MAAQAQTTFNLWPNGNPNDNCNPNDQIAEMTVYTPNAANDTGVGVVILPGGAYIGRQITDYGKEPERLVEAVSASDKPLTIITRTSRLETIPELQKLFSNGTVLYSGPYCLTTISKK